MARAKGSNGGLQSKALDVIFRRHAGWLQAMLRRRFGRSISDPEDLVQETYLRLARSGEVLELRRPQALLLQVAGNLAVDQIRRRDTAARGKAHLSAAAAAAPLRVFGEQEELLILRRLILDLPQPYRDTLLLARFGHLTQQEIARHFNVSVKTVEWRLSKALSMCAQGLDDEAS